MTHTNIITVLRLASYDPHLENPHIVLRLLDQRCSLTHRSSTHKKRSEEQAFERKRIFCELAAAIHAKTAHKKLAARQASAAAGRADAKRARDLAVQHEMLKSAGASLVRIIRPLQV